MSFEPIVPFYIPIIIIGLMLIFIIICIVMPKYRRVNNFIKISVIILVCVAALRPIIHLEGADVSKTTSDIAVYLIIDNTGSMASKDIYDKARIEVAKKDAQIIVNAFPDAQYAIFAQDVVTYQMQPLSPDLDTTIAAIKYMGTKTTRLSEGTDLNLLINTASNSIDSYLKTHQNQKAVVFILSDGEVATKNSGALKLDDGNFKNVAGGMVIGYGTQGGGKVPKIIANDDGATLYYRQDKNDPYVTVNGAPVISRIDENNLRSIADKYNFTYGKSNDIVKTTNELKKKIEEKATFEVYYDPNAIFETYWIFMIFATVLLLVELYRDLNKLLEEYEAKR